jgi:hypothetical protein
MTHSSKSSRHVPVWLKAAFPWFAFLAMLLWAWRTGPLAVPSYGDTLETVWGAQWYANALSKGISPLFMPNIFYPLGWHTGTLAHTPALFILALPFQLVGGAGVAYAGLVVLALALSFAGCLRLIGLRADRFVATLLGLIYTFAFFRWLCADGGHMHFLWGTSFLPWIVWAILRLRDEAAPARRRRYLLFAGLAWAGALYFSLYFVWIGALPLFLLLFDRQRSLWQHVRQIIAIAIVAVIAAAPTLVLFFLGSRADQLSSNDASVLLAWGASLNSFITPPLVHPVPALQSLARAIFQGDTATINEVNESNWGILLPLTAVLGAVIGLRRTRDTRALLAVLGVSLLLALGIALQWNGTTVQSGLFTALNALLWQIGHLIKPSLFPSATLPSDFANIVPLPGFLLTAVVPFWESARVAARFSIVGGLMLCLLAAIALQHMPRVAKGVLAVLLLIEMLPSPTQSRPLPTAPHPAYTWLAEQHMPPGQSIIELDVTPIRKNGAILLTALDYGIPTVSGAGSFLPKPTLALGTVLGRTPHMLALPDVAILLSQFGVKYVVIHMKAGTENTYEWGQWQAAQANPSMKAVRCFDPTPQNQVLGYPICIAEVNAPAAPAYNVLREEGWSEFEQWGVWMLGRTSRATWIALHPTAHTLHLNAFPVCVAGQNQHVTVYVNDAQLATHDWTNCDAWDETLTIPAKLVKAGANTIRFEAAYALQAGGGQVKDETRPLSVGFSALQVQPVTP